MMTYSVMSDDASCESLVELKSPLSYISIRHCMFLSYTHLYPFRAQSAIPMGSSLNLD